MPPHDDEDRAEHPYVWAYRILKAWREGRAFDPDPDHIGGGGTGMMGAVFKALDVERVADRHDPGISRQRIPINRARSWFVLWFIEHDQVRWSPHDRWLLERALKMFEDELHDKGIMG